MIIIAQCETRPLFGDASHYFHNNKAECDHYALCETRPLLGDVSHYFQQQQMLM